MKLYFKSWTIDEEWPRVMVRIECRYEDGTQLTEIYQINIGHRPSSDRMAAINSKYMRVRALLEGCPRD